TAGPRNSRLDARARLSGGGASLAPARTDTVREGPFSNLRTRAGTPPRASRKLVTTSTGPPSAAFAAASPSGGDPPQADQNVYARRAPPNALRDSEPGQAHS